MTVLTASTTVGDLVEVQGFKRVAGSLNEIFGLLLGGAKEEFGCIGGVLCASVRVLNSLLFRQTKESFLHLDCEY